MNRIVASLHGSIGTKNYEKEKEIRKSPPICGQKPTPVKCTRIVAPVPVDIRFSGVSHADQNVINEKVIKKNTLIGLSKATVKRRQSLDKLKDELQCILDSNLQDESKKNTEKLDENVKNANVLADGSGITDDNKSTRSSMQNGITLSPTLSTQNKAFDRMSDRNHDMSSRKPQQQDQGKILSYIRQQRLKRKVQLKQEKNEKLSMEQAKKQRLKELQDKTLKILADNIKHRKNDKKTRTTHSMVMPVLSAENQPVGKGTIYMRGKLKSAQNSREAIAVEDEKKIKTDDAEGYCQTEVKSTVDLKKSEKPSTTEIFISEPHNIIKPIPIAIESNKPSRLMSKESLHNDEELMFKIKQDLEPRENENIVLIRRITLIQACIRGFLQRKKYKRILREKEILSTQNAKPISPLTVPSVKIDQIDDILPHYLRQGVVKPCPYNFITAVKKKINLAVTGSVPYSQRTVALNPALGDGSSIKSSCENFTNLLEIQSQKNATVNLTRRSSSCDSKKLHLKNREKYESKCHFRQPQDCSSRRSTSADSNSCSRLLSNRFSRDEELKSKASDKALCKNSGDSVSRNDCDHLKTVLTNFANSIKTDGEDVFSKTDERSAFKSITDSAKSSTNKQALDISEIINTEASSSLNSRKQFTFDGSIKKLESPKSDILISNHEYESTFTKFSSEPHVETNDFNSCSKNERRSSTPSYNIKVEDKLMADLKNLSDLYTTFSAYVDAENNTSRELSPIRSEKSKKTDDNTIMSDVINFEENVNSKKDANASSRLSGSEEFLKNCNGNLHNSGDQAKSQCLEKPIREHINKICYPKTGSQNIAEEINRSSQNIEFSQDASKDSELVTDNDFKNNMTNMEILKESIDKSHISSASEKLKSCDKNVKITSNNKLTERNKSGSISTKPYSNSNYSNECFNSQNCNIKNTCNLVYTQYSSEFEYSKSSNSSNVEKLKLPKYRLKFDESKYTTIEDRVKKQTHEKDKENISKTASNDSKKNLSKSLPTSEILPKNEDIKTVIRYIEDLKTLSKTLFENKDTQTSFKANKNEVNVNLGSMNDRPKCSVADSLHSVASDNEILELYIPPLDLSRINSSHKKSSCSSSEDVQNLQNARSYNNNAATETESSASIFIAKINHKNNDSVSLNNLDKMLHEEYLKVLRLKSMLKKKEQSLIERTKDEITLLENRKRELKISGNINEIPSLKKKQRGLLLNLQQERHELEKMKKRYKKTYSERKQIIKNNRRHFGKINNIRENEKASLWSKERENNDIDFENSDEYSAMLSKREKELQRRRSHVEALLLWSRRLDEREKEITEMESRLQLAKKSSETLQTYPKRSSKNLSEDFYNERTVVLNHEHLQTLTESDSSCQHLNENLIYQSPNLETLGRRLKIPENSEFKKQNSLKENISHHERSYLRRDKSSSMDLKIEEHKNNYFVPESKTSVVLDSVMYDRPKYFVDNMHEQKTRNITSFSNSRTKGLIDATDRKSYLGATDQKLEDENYDNKIKLGDSNNRHFDLLLNKSECVENIVSCYPINSNVPNLDNKFGDISQIHPKSSVEAKNTQYIHNQHIYNKDKTETVPNLDRSMIETVQINSKVSHFVQTEIGNISKHKTDKSVQTARFKKVKGSDLNRLWKHITGSKKKIYSDFQVYKMTKKNLEDFYEDAKKEAITQFSENDDTLISVFHNSLSDENSAQKNIASEQNLQTTTYDSHKCRKNVEFDQNVLEKSLENISLKKKLESESLAKFAQNDNIISECIITAFDDLSKTLKNRNKCDVDESTSKEIAISDEFVQNDNSVQVSKNYMQNTSKDFSKSVQTSLDESFENDILKSTETIADEVVYSQNFENPSQSNDVESSHLISEKVQSDIETRSRTQMVETNGRSNITILSNEDVSENIVNYVTETVSTSDNIENVMTGSSKNSVNTETLPGRVNDNENSKKRHLTDSETSKIMKEGQKFNKSCSTSIHTAQNSQILDGYAGTSSLNDVSLNNKSNYMQNSLTSSLLNEQSINTYSRNECNEISIRSNSNIDGFKKSENKSSILELTSPSLNSRKSSHSVPTKSQSGYLESSNSNSQKSLQHEDLFVGNDATSKKGKTNYDSFSTCSVKSLAESLGFSISKSESNSKNVNFINKNKISFNNTEIENGKTVNDISENFSSKNSEKSKNTSIKKENVFSSEYCIKPHEKDPTNAYDISHFEGSKHKNSSSGSNLGKNENRKNELNINSPKSENEHVVYYFTELTTNKDENSDKAEGLNKPNGESVEISSKNCTSLPGSPEKITSSSDNLANLPQEITLEKLDDILQSDYAISVSSHYTSVDKIYEENEEVIQTYHNSNGSTLDSPTEKHSNNKNISTMTDTNFIGSVRIDNAFKDNCEYDSAPNINDKKSNISGKSGTLISYSDNQVDDISQNHSDKQNIFEKKVFNDSDISSNVTSISDYTFSEKLKFKKLNRSLDDDLPKVSALKENLGYLEIAQDLITCEKNKILEERNREIVTQEGVTNYTIIDSDLEKGLLKIDSSLKYLNDTFEKVPVLDKLTRSNLSQTLPTDFESNVYTSSVSERYLDENSDATSVTDQPLLEKIFSEPIGQKIPKSRHVSYEIAQKIIDYQNLSPRGKQHNFFQFTHSDENLRENIIDLTLSPIKPKDLLAECVYARVKNHMTLHLEPTIFETASEDKYLEKNSEHSSKAEKFLDETGDFQKIEDVSCLDLMLNDTTKTNADNESNDIPEEIFWYEDENEGSFKENNSIADATFDFGCKGAISSISPTKQGLRNGNENLSDERSKETSEVIERVRQIMENRNQRNQAILKNNSNGSSASPRLQDLWITTNENLTPSPGNSPPVSPVISQLSSEAEELRRKQLEIELEIKRLQQQSESVEFYVREIPNKPPPPYTPPVKPTSCQQSETSSATTQLDEDAVSCHSIKHMTADFPQPLSRDHIESLIVENTRTLYDAFINGKITLSEYSASSESNINEKLVFDLCKEVIIDHFKYSSDIPIWLKGKRNLPHKNVYYNLEDLTEFVRKKVLQFMNLEPGIVTPKLLSRAGSNKEGVREVVIERSDWKMKDCDYELLCKENVTNCIMNMLLTETADVVSESFRRKNLASKNL